MVHPKDSSAGTFFLTLALSHHFQWWTRKGSTVPAEIGYVLPIGKPCKGQKEEKT